MKQRLSLCLVGCLIVCAVGAGTLSGQETSTFEKRVAPPKAPSPPGAPDVVEYWNNDDEDVPSPEMLEGDAATPHVVPFPHQRIERDRIFIRGDAGPWLGVALSDLNAEKAKELKLAGEDGVWVKEVREDSPAAKAGIQKDDVIIEFAGEKVRSAAQLHRLVRETAPDRSVSLVVSRAGQTKTLTAKIEPRPERAFAFAGVPVPPAMPHIDMPKFNVFVPHQGARLGISADELTPQLAAFFGVKQGKGVLVREVTVGSAAEKAGLKAGDVIVALDGKEVASVGKLRRALAGEKEQTEKRKVALTIVRDKREQTLSVELDPAQQTGPHPFMRAELGLDPEEMREMAEEARAQAQEAQEEMGDHAQEFADEQGEFQLDQKQLQQDMQELQKQMPELQELQKQMPEIEKEIKRNLGGTTVNLETI